MTKHARMLVTSAFILASGTIAATAQQNSNTPMMQQPKQAQQGDPADEGGSGMMGHEGMMRHCMAMMGHGMMGQGGMMGAFPMRIIFALMDSDGDGTISLEEFQAAHQRIFKAMDTDKDGTLTLEEMKGFIRGAGKSAPQR
jgi:Ca2+-binding EF-hand superfamily protein